MGVLRIAAVFNVWGDCNLLPYAVENIRPVVDGVIIVWSRKSNRGQEMDYDLPKDCTLVQWEPVQRAPNLNELAKRNVGLERAKKDGYTHFIMMDADEFYVREEFMKAKDEVKSEVLAGSVCRIQTYFKKPTLTIGIDNNTLVPFIHKITPNLEYKLNYHGYPFAYVNGAAVIDPTRRLNIHQGVKMMSITMHHYSWVRKDISLKMNNSSANLRGSRGDVLLEDLQNAKPGYFCRGYQKVLRECENLFNLPEYD